MRCRLIPARAGKTLISGGPRGAVPAHPRACGENRASEAASMVPGGSSPRVRGKRRSRAGQDTLGGLIPARAGKTPAGPRKRPRRPAHPRACGENVKTVWDWVSSLGSSPRVRGKLLGVGRVPVPPGLIPARAGKTLPCGHTEYCPEAHPRACGENGWLEGSAGGVEGSSPRVRGKHCR